MCECKVVRSKIRVLHEDGAEQGNVEIGETGFPENQRGQICLSGFYFAKSRMTAQGMTSAFPNVPWHVCTHSHRSSISIDVRNSQNWRANECTVSPSSSNLFVNRRRHCHYCVVVFVLASSAASSSWSSPEAHISALNLGRNLCLASTCWEGKQGRGTSSSGRGGAKV